jgi:hypothetical protein
MQQRSRSTPQNDHKDERRSGEFQDRQAMRILRTEARAHLKANGPSQRQQGQQYPMVGVQSRSGDEQGRVRELGTGLRDAVGFGEE